MNNMIVFVKEKSIDEKGRIILNNSGIDIGETLYLFYSNERDCIIIRSEDSVKKIRDKYLAMDPIEREEEYDKINAFFFNCIGEAKIDKQSRLTLGADICAEINMENSAFVIGCFDEVRIYPSKKYREIVSKNVKVKKIGSI